MPHIGQSLHLDADEEVHHSIVAGSRPFPILYLGNVRDGDWGIFFEIDHVVEQCDAMVEHLLDIRAWDLKRRAERDGKVTLVEA